MEEFIKEMDEAKEECYKEFLELLSLDDTAQTWEAFDLAWSTGNGWGLDQEYSYPS